ncbi:sigma-54 dependent transcriptional regulator [Marinobacter sp. M3C]|uniref:sigma 54-interacting transcriptional regulator n=1 Tax=Marinobacter sp. M3C TaxID=2917715 RepID=UPI00200C97BA|nr:sigma-54 dependent transcriptional regulator [Marinobacter sp. M3C]UQG59076.1 sigma-54 dependent transcriptional regulator [Marinobacter sp. M3C]
MPPCRTLIWLSTHVPDIPEFGSEYQVYAINASDDMPLAPPSCAGTRAGVADLRRFNVSDVGNFCRWIEFLGLRYWVAIVDIYPSPGSDTQRFIARYCSDYHSAPLDMGRFTAMLGHLWGMAELQIQTTDGYDSNRRGPDFNDVVLTGSSPAICDTRSLLRRFAAVDEPVLITGESGSGKEAAAHFIQKNSNRTYGPHVVVNCAALPESLTQSELFGYEQGAFTHALKAHPGRLELAHRGTVLLAGIDELSMKQQSALLPFLQEGRLERIGGKASFIVDVRILATSSSDLGELVRQGEFRSDVFYRLGSLIINMPALRQRPDDIITLALLLLDQNNTPKKLSTAAISALAHHTWPGNLRELQNRLRRAGLLSDSATISPRSLGLQAALPTPGNPSQLTLSAFRNEAERHALSCSLNLAQHNVSAAARMLAISRVSFYRLLEKHKHTTLHLDEDSEGDCV